MQREAIPKTCWSDLTLTALREKQYEACEKRLASRSGKALFDPETTAADVQALAEASFYGASSQLYDIRLLRSRVHKSFAEEAALLSTDETELLGKLSLSEGPLEIDEWNEIGAAEGLLNRLWCGFIKQSDHLFLTLPAKLKALLPAVFSSEKYLKARSELSALESFLDGLLYLEGKMDESLPLSILLDNVLCRKSEWAVELARRYLKTSYDYVTEADGSLTLLHPGLVRTDGKTVSFLDSHLFYLQSPPDLVGGAVQGILPEEIPLHEALCGVMIGAARPELDISESAEDLRILVKQGISFDDLKSVFSTMIMTQPTDRMISVLKNLYQGTPRWHFASPALLN